MTVETGAATPDGGASDTDAAAAAPTFEELDVHPAIVQALSAAGITHAFPIQAMTLPVALSGSDIIGQAKTGTGKTLGFGIPLLQRVMDAVDATGATKTKTPRALVVVPTRELCVQVTRDLELAGRERDVTVLSVYGGRAYEPQIEALRRGVDVVVGTPGRLLDLAQQRHLDLSGVRTLVLDEADEMLDLGFLPDVERIVAQVPAERQTMLFSATMPGQVVALARRYMSRPTHIRAVDHSTGTTADNVEQHVFRAHAMDKTQMLARLLQAEGRGLAMIFARTKRTVAKVAEDLTERGFAVAAVHGDLGQGAREQALRAFRSGKVDVLVATDVAARGIDVEGVTHVINYQCPEDEKVYLHRIGRTARAGRSGVAVTFVDWDELPRWSLINKALGLDFAEVPETYSTSPHFLAALGIDPGTKGVLPRAERTRAGLAAEEIEDLGETGKSHGSGGTKSRRTGRGPSAGSGTGTGSGSGDGGAADDGDSPRGRRSSRTRRRTRGGSAVSGDAPGSTVDATPDGSGDSAA
ncbi:MAG: DEAD/DEAH box helicase, partial [Actinomycetes bacterium]